MRLVISIVFIIDQNMYVCLCKGITESMVREMGRASLLSPDTVTRELGIDEDDCCGRCLRHIKELVALAANESVTATSR